MRDGRRNDCKACNLLAKHDRYVANPEPMKERVRQWQADNRDRYNETQRRRRGRPDVQARTREDYLVRKYGITQAGYDALLVRQGGGCALGDLGDEPARLERALAYLEPVDDEQRRLEALIRLRLGRELLRQ